MKMVFSVAVNHKALQDCYFEYENNFLHATLNYTTNSVLSLTVSLKLLLHN